eukprot:850254_1
MSALLLFILLSDSKGEHFSNPTTDIKCGRNDNCLIHCSNTTSCSGLYFIFENDWSVTNEKYNASLICDGPAACNNIKVFGNRSSFIHLDISPAYYDVDSVEVHILFGTYNKGPQFADIHCGNCEKSQFYYSSLKHNASVIQPTDGIVHHYCGYCGSENIISAVNVYELHLKLGNGAVSDFLSVYPPIHNNSPQSFVLESNTTSVRSNGHLLLYFLNGLQGKAFVCKPYDITWQNRSYTIGCTAFDYGKIRVYCGPYFAVWSDSINILTGSYSNSGCASIYDSKMTNQLTKPFLPHNTFIFNAHRYYTYHQDYMDMYNNSFSNDTVIVMMVDSYVPQETNRIQSVTFPSNTNVFILCNGVDDMFDGNCAGSQQQHVVFDGSDTFAMTLMGSKIEYATIKSGVVFHMFPLMYTRFNTYHLENSVVVYMKALETYGEAVYEGLGSIFVGAESVHVEIYLDKPVYVTLDCNHPLACSYATLFSQSGAYQYIPEHWKITCYKDYDTYGFDSCDPFWLSFGDGSRCEMNPGGECTSWIKGPPTTQAPTRRPSRAPTMHTTASPSYHPSNVKSTWYETVPTESDGKSLTDQLLENRNLLVSVASVVIMMTITTLLGLCHRYNADKTCFMKCLNAADDFNALALIGMALAVWDFASDWNWAFSINCDKYVYYFYASISLNIASWVLNFVYLLKLIHKLKQDVNVSIWLRKYICILMMLAIISSKVSTAISVCNCHLFGLDVFDMGLSLFQTDIEINRWKVLLGTVLRNIPQIILQLLYVSLTSTMEIATLSAFLSSSCSVVVTIAAFVIKAGIKWNPKTFTITLHLSSTDALNPLLPKRRYLRRKVRNAICEATGIDGKCVCVDAIHPPLLIVVSIVQQGSTQELIDALTYHKHEIAQHLGKIFILSDEFDVDISKTSKEIIVFEIDQKENNLSQPLLNIQMTQ